MHSIPVLTVSKNVIDCHILELEHQLRTLKNFFITSICGMKSLPHVGMQLYNFILRQGQNLSCFILA